MPLPSQPWLPAPPHRRARLDPGVYDLFDFNKDVKKAISELAWVMLRTMGGQGDARIDGITRYPTAIFQRIVDYASVIHKDEWAKVQLQSYADERATNPPRSHFYCEILMGVGQDWIHLHRIIKEMLFCRPVLSDLINFIHTNRHDATYAHLVGFWFSAEDWVVIAACKIVLDYHYRTSHLGMIFPRLAELLRAWHVYTGPLDSLQLSLFIVLRLVLHPGWSAKYLYTIWLEAGTPMTTLHHRFVRIVLAKNNIDADSVTIGRVEWEIVVYLHKLAELPPYITGTKHDLWNHLFRQDFLGNNLPLLHNAFRAFHMPMLARRAVGNGENRQTDESRMDQNDGHHLPAMQQIAPQQANPVAAGNTRPARTTRGRGGHAEQLERTGIAVQGTPSQSRKRHVSSDIEGERVNPAAPPVRGAPKRARSSANTGPSTEASSIALAPNANHQAPINGGSAIGPTYQNGGQAQFSAQPPSFPNPSPAFNNNPRNAYQITGLASQYASTQGMEVGGGGTFPSNPAFLSHNTAWNNGHAPQPSYLPAQGNLEPSFSMTPLNQGTVQMQFSNQLPGSRITHPGGQNAFPASSHAGQGELNFSLPAAGNQTVPRNILGVTLSPIREINDDVSEAGSDLQMPAPFRRGIDDESPDSTARRMEQVLHSAIPIHPSYAGNATAGESGPPRQSTQTSAVNHTHPPFPSITPTGGTSSQGGYAQIPSSMTQNVTGSARAPQIEVPAGNLDGLLGQLTTLRSGSVLDDHHRRNGMPVPPELEDENVSKKSKKKRPAKNKRKNQQSSVSSAVDDAEVSEVTTQTRAVRNSKLDPDRSIPADQLQFYPSGWRWVLNKGSWIIRCTIYTEFPWITKGNGRQEARECLLEAVRLAKQQDVTLEPGYEIDQHMENYILNVAPGCRGKVRDVALKVVVSHYKVESLRVKYATLQLKREAIVRKVTGYLKDGAFLHGKTVNGVASNFGNDGLRQVVKQAYYGADSIANRFPSYFAKR
ncbi:hypothetical protein SISSUDRAFT_1100590, partial [Sistotremastrum suecicum HHB10207 ss-3]